MCVCVCVCVCVCIGVKGGVAHFVRSYLDHVGMLQLPVVLVWSARMAADSNSCGYMERRSWTWSWRASLSFSLDIGCLNVYILLFKAEHTVNEC